MSDVPQLHSLFLQFQLAVAVRGAETLCKVSVSLLSALQSMKSPCRYAQKHSGALYISYYSRSLIVLCNTHRWTEKNNQQQKVESWQQVA